MSIVMSAPSRGATVVGHDVWPGWDLVTDHARTLMTGTAAELDRIATEHGLRG